MGTGREFDKMPQSWLEGHKKSSTADVQQDDDFMRNLLSVADTVAEEFPGYDAAVEEFPGDDANTIYKATCLV